MTIGQTRAIRAVLETRLAALGKELNLVLRLGNAKYDPRGGPSVFKLEVNEVGGMTSADQRRKQTEADLKQFGESLGMRAKVGDIIRLGARVFAVAGLDLSKRKNSVILWNNGREFFCSIGQANMALNRAANLVPESSVRTAVEESEAAWETRAAAEADIKEIAPEAAANA